MSRRRSSAPLPVAISLAKATPRAFTVAVVIVVAVVQVVCAGGCVQRRMTIRSNVPGAQVYVDNYEIGRTPVSTDFVYYGQRDVRLVKDGYETLKVEQKLNAPWYQYPGIDFLVENVWPFEIRDERNFNYQMQPQYLVPTETILSRAEELRTANAQSTTPPVATQPIMMQPMVGQPGMTQPVVGQPGMMQPAATLPGYATPPPGTVGAPIAPGYPAQPSPYAPQNPAGAPRL